ncbi:hypothetical protein [Streptomyces halstedii]|uniref:Uncharacterized protein n=1 Tax=Streptomyces halstedii TaxID=1944 RepID=A0A6N9U7I0_STRHA|nr:hypothetical protein [Streptomyces halstedii]NEA19834.1 hypothetical protein [Streptomyces halstedii]
MARRTMAQRRLRTALREDRRGVLAHLLSRSDRGVITHAERPLLRAHVEAELRDADDLRRTVNGQQKVIQRLGRQLDAAHDAIREAEQAADAAEQLRAYRAVEEQRNRIIAAGTIPAEWWTATAADRRATHIRAFLDEQTAHLDDPVPQHTGGNAEACPACTAHNPPYPFLCPAPSTPEQP